MTVYESFQHHEHHWACSIGASFSPAHHIQIGQPGAGERCTGELVQAALDCMPVLDFGIGAIHVEIRQPGHVDITQVVNLVQRVTKPVEQRFTPAVRFSTAGKQLTGVRNGEIERRYRIRTHADGIINREARFRITQKVEPLDRIGIRQSNVAVLDRRKELSRNIVRVAQWRSAQEVLDEGAATRQFRELRIRQFEIRLADQRYKRSRHSSCELVFQPVLLRRRPDARHVHDAPQIDGQVLAQVSTKLAEHYDGFIGLAAMRARFETLDSK
ncbi:hypothetical protein PQQ62_08795 [Caballeronia grimmiae]